MNIFHAAKDEVLSISKKTAKWYFCAPYVEKRPSKRSEKIINIYIYISIDAELGIWKQ